MARKARFDDGSASNSATENSEPGIGKCVDRMIVLKVNSLEQITFGVHPFFSFRCTPPLRLIFTPTLAKSSLDINAHPCKRQTFATQNARRLL
jgi:hypothetical protein